MNMCMNIISPYDYCVCNIQHFISFSIFFPQIIVIALKCWYIWPDAMFVKYNYRPSLHVVIIFTTSLVILHHLREQWSRQSSVSYCRHGIVGIGFEPTGRLKGPVNSVGDWLLSASACECVLSVVD